MTKNDTRSDMSRASIQTINLSVLQRAEYNLTQAKCRCASSMPIARGCIAKSDDLASQCLVDIRTHTGRLYCAMSEMVDLEILQSHQETGWRQALHYLFMVQSITGIASDSAFYLGDQTNSCSCLNAYDSLVDEISQNYLTASVRFSLIFTALECATKARSSNLVVVGAREARQTAGGLRKMAESRSYNELGHDLDASLTLTESMRSARDVALAACLTIGDMAEDLADLSIKKDGSSSDKDTFIYCLKLLKKFRNRFSHGDEIVWMPDNGEVKSGSAGPESTALVDRHNAMSRIALITMQLCLTIDSRTDFKFRVGTDDECVETFMMASKVFKHLHYGNYGARSLIKRVQGPKVERMPRSIYEERARRIRAERAAAMGTAAA